MKIAAVCFLSLLPRLCFGDALVLKSGQTIYGTCVTGSSATNYVQGIQGFSTSPKIGWILFKTQSGVEQRFDIEAIKELRLDGISLFAVFGQEAQDRKQTIIDQHNAMLLESLIGRMPTQQKPPGSGSPLVGTWVYESQAFQTYEHVVLTLRANGTYTRTLKLRAFGPGSATGGGTDQGTWTAKGNIVTVSGDGYLNARAYDLQKFSKAQ